MNKPAPKEPSMDEILSSIRQIIADDDAATAPRRPLAPTASPATPPMSRDAAPAGATPAPAESEAEPLALTPEQMLRDEPKAPAPLSFSDILGKDSGTPDEDEGDPGPQLVDPEDITFDAEDGDRSAQAFSVPVHEPEPLPPPKPAAAPSPPPPRPSVARTAPMPDPTLSAEMAERLLEPTTDAAVKHTFSKLSGLSMTGSGQTIEALLRDMLRPMLKEWLDENLPAIVERMVEKEISRISRGV